MTLVDFYTVAYAFARSNSKTQRFGQAFFNYLDSVRPDITAKVRGTDQDPFYNNDNLSRCFKFVDENWDTTPGFPNPK